MTPQDALAALAVEYWKLLRTLERAVAAAPDNNKPRLVAQLRYASSRLDGLLEGQGMAVVGFDGQPYQLNMPAAAVNAEDFAGDDETVVQQTLEPAVIAHMAIVTMGKVYLARKVEDVSRD